MLKIETERLIITEFTPDMAQAVHENSLDEDNRRFDLEFKGVGDYQGEKREICRYWYEN